MFIPALFRIAQKWKWPNAHQKIKGYTKCGVAIQWNIQQLKKFQVLIHATNMDEPWKHAKWKKPITKSTYSDSIHIKCWIGISTETYLWWSGAQRKEDLEMMAKGWGLFYLGVRSSTTYCSNGSIILIKVTEFMPFEWIIWYTNNISIKLFLKYHLLVKQQRKVK